MDTDIALLLREINDLVRSETAKRYSGTNVLLSDCSLEFNVWLAQKLKEQHFLTDTKLSPEVQFMYYSLRDRGVVIDRVTGSYLLCGETDIRRTTITRLEQLVFSLYMLANTPLRYTRLTEQFVFQDLEIDF